jgi:hypothetical protein
MGQYYLALILAEKTEQEEFIRYSLHPHYYNNGMKLMEHAFKNNEFVVAVENIISPEGMFYKSRVVWAGDYADDEPFTDINLHKMVKKIDYNDNTIPNLYKYIINHTKKQYVDKNKTEIHPLPLLTAEGNGNGGGDYYGVDEYLVGVWARDVISVNNEIPADYVELVCKFKENRF